MIPKRVVLENFLSFGSRTEIVFDGEPLWVLCGSNGVGKSAVFDAITFCLFGEHRGGKQGLDNLVRHGANGFAVTFEFEFGGTDYRVTKNRQSRSPVHSVERQTSTGEWKRVPSINSAKDVDEWSVRTLGLSATSFETCVLLRQGKADQIVEAKPTDRFKILRGIIGGERYEHLAHRVQEVAKSHDGELKRLQRRREAIEEVTIEQLAAAESAEHVAKATKTIAADRVEHAVAQRSEAKIWNELQRDLSDLERKIAEAQARIADGDRIRAEYAQLTQLDDALPILQQLLPKERDLANLDGTLSELRAAAEATAQQYVALEEELQRTQAKAIELRTARVEDDRTLQALHQSIERLRKFRSLATTLTEHRVQLSTYPDTLDSDRLNAASCHQNAQVALRVARDAVAQVRGELNVATNRQKQLDSLEVGVNCSACGQPVTAEHAEKERHHATAAVNDLAEKLRLREAEANATTLQEANTKKQLDDLECQLQKRDTLQQTITQQVRMIESMGGSSDIEALDREIAEQERTTNQLAFRSSEAATQLAELDQIEARLQAELPSAKQAAEHAAHELKTADQRGIADRIECTLLRQRLASPFQSTTLTELPALVTTHVNLRDSGVVEQFKCLEQGNGLIQEWCSQRETITQKIQAIPETARISTDAADEAHVLAVEECTRADQNWQTARDDHQRLGRLYDECVALRKNIETAETNHRLHKRLYELLGRTGLQRELIRDAERQIVEYANQTVSQLSDGDLSIELDSSPNKDGEALVLLVRRLDDSTSIPVEYLSGSQKFRVAVSLALAMGRFAAGQARPIESVVIDEGFGSLDKDGLRAMADELIQLKDRSTLKRIILVSHQEEFVNCFPVGWRLSRGEDGTKAERFRR
jgi:DNA repair protein SbcC/Rad50